MRKDAKVEDDKSTKIVEIKLIEGTVEKRNELISTATERAKQIIQTTEQECKRIRTQHDEPISNNRNREIQTFKERIIGGTELEGRKLLMHAREEAISKVYKKVEDRLREIAEQRDDDYDFIEILIKLVIEGASAIGGKSFIVFANKRDSEYLKRNQNKIVKQLHPILGNVTLQVQDKQITTIGGVIVQDSDRTKTYYNTLEGRLKTVRNRSEAVVAKILEVL